MGGFVGLFALSHVSFLFLSLLVSKGFALMINLVFLESISLNLDLTLIFDAYSCGFLAFVYLISAAMIYYSFFYMEGDMDVIRFISLVFLFIFSMTLLVLSPNLITLMLGWDGLGVTSFCLVIYYQNTSSLRSGLITVYMNRVGDVFMMISIFYYFQLAQWDAFGVSKSWESFYPISMLLILAAMTKSAQIPFSVWLPAAMAAPTPVSALVHSSTLVTAGVYLLIRFYKALCGSLNTWWFYILGGMTMFFSGIMACLEQDFKKIIALSTLSQLGLMMIMLAIGAWKFSYYHMISHALFKSLLFLSSGVLLVYLSGGQDLRIHGSVMKKGGVLKLILFFSCLSLMGFPFTAGFYSKDLMLEKSGFTMPFLDLFFFLIISCVMTVFYSLKMSYSGLTNLEGKTSSLQMESKKFGVSILILCLWATLGGSMLSKVFLMEEMMAVSHAQKFMGVFILLSGGCSFFYLSFYLLSLKNKFYQMLMLLGDMYFLGWVSVKSFLFTLEKLSAALMSEFAWLENMPKTSFTLSVSISKSLDQSTLFLKLGLALMIFWALKTTI